MGKARESNNQTHQKVENCAVGHIQEPSRTNSCNVRFLFVLDLYEKKSLTNLFLSDDGEMHQSGSPSQELDEVAEAKESDVDEEEGGVFDKEDVAQDSESGDFGGASETLDGMVVVGGEKVSEDNGMPGMRASVQNSQGFGVEPVPT